jgi:hypothetical protein
MPDQPHLPTPPAAPEPGAPEPTDREVYRQRLREALRDPAFRAIEGFPIGSDEAILALSDPPTYTACPNPFLPEILQRWREERRQLRARLGLPPDDPPQEEPGLPRRPTYHREPFAADVSEGKNDPIYNAHSYHTKVPHRAIMRYILHYTDPGDIVLDGFCGTGMTGVAAQLCGDRRAVQSLGYRVQDDGTVLEVIITQNTTHTSANAGQLLAVALHPVARKSARCIIGSICKNSPQRHRERRVPITSASRR